MAMVTPNSLLKVFTKDYKNKPYSDGLFFAMINPQRPVFYRMFIPYMLKDPHLWYGMEILKGPIISKAKFEVECENLEVAEFVNNQLTNFWTKSSAKALDCLTWGYACSEVLYEYNEDTRAIEFKDLKYLRPRDVKAVTKGGQLVAAQITQSHLTQPEMYLSPPKIFWAVHDKKSHRWYGRSRLEGAFDAWWEMWQPKGYRGIRHLWFYKNAYSGGVLYYPDGTTIDPDTGEEIPNSLIAQEMLDRKETGSGLALPRKSETDTEWEWIDPKGNEVTDSLMTYGEVLRDELWEGIGVPPEVAKSEGTGSFAGRRVPQQAFYSYIQEIANELAYDFDEQVIAPLVELAFGKVRYKIVPVSIMETLQKEEMGLVTGTVPGDEGEMDENGDPIMEKDESELSPEEKQQKNQELQNQNKGGKLEDRDSNAHNIKEKSNANKNQKVK